MKLLHTLFLSIAIIAVTAGPGAADFDSGSTGADGLFNPLSDVTIDLSLAGTGAGTGVYDTTRWAVVFNYTGIDIPAGVTVDFINHPSGAPVVWLASADVTIAGLVDVSGKDGESVNPANFSVPGPGGFAGARRAIDPVTSPATGGFGPGGAPFTPATFGAGGGGYATAGGSGDDTTAVGGGTYGNIAVLPLIGGSGGATPNVTSKQGGPGGGAILIACSANILLEIGGEVRARGGDGGGNAGSSGGGGSGGAIRLLADKVSGNGLLRAQGGSGLAGVRAGDGGDGRIRVEADSIDITDLGNPSATFSLSPGPIFPDAGAPTLAATLIMGEIVPADPQAGITTTDIVVMDTSAVVIEIEATNVPVGTVVDVVIVPNGGPGFTVQSTPLAGTLANSTATASVLFTPGTKTEIFLRADFGTSSVSGRGDVSRQ